MYVRIMLQPSFAIVFAEVLKVIWRENNNFTNNLWVKHIFIYITKWNNKSAKLQERVLFG